MLAQRSSVARAFAALACLGFAASIARGERVGTLDPDTFKDEIAAREIAA